MHQAFRVMDTHFDFLYGLCHTQEDQNRMLQRMLSLLNDPKEIAQVRSRFYALNKGFARLDRKQRFRQELRHIKGMPKRALRKAKKLLTEKKK